MSEANPPADELARSPIRDRSGLTRLIDAIDASLERRFWLWAAVFTIVFFVCSIVRDLKSTLWFDELFTLYIARLGSPEAIIGFDDPAPPLYPLIAHFILPLVQNEALAIRLPATLGYCAMIVCVWAFCRKRLPAPFAFAVPLLTFERGLFFATDGRTYGLVLGCAGGALLCWQMATEGRRRGLAIALLAFLLALMVALHYYAIFFLVPLFVAEMVRWRVSGKADVALWTAMAPAPIVLGLHYVLFVAGQNYDTYFWAQPSFGAIQTFYERFLLPPLIFGGLAFVVGWLLPGSSAPQAGVQKPGFPLHEWAMIAALVLLPPVVIVVSMYTTHVFIERYILWTVIGFSLLGAVALSAAGRGRARGLALIVIALVATARLEIGPLLEGPVLRTAEGMRQELVAFAMESPEPIVVANAHAFLELSYYLNSPLRERIVFPLSRELDLQYRGFDTDALTLSSLAQIAPISVKAYEAILAENKSFLLAATNADYLVQHLAAASYRVTPIDGATMLYRVQAPE